MFSGESRGRAVERAVIEMNEDGYRVVFIVDDKPSFLWRLLNAAIAIGTVGFYWRTGELLIIGERV